MFTLITCTEVYFIKSSSIFFDALNRFMDILPEYASTTYTLTSNPKGVFLMSMDLCIRVFLNMPKSSNLPLLFETIISPPKDSMLSFTICARTSALIVTSPLSVSIFKFTIIRLTANYTPQLS